MPFDALTEADPSPALLQLTSLEAAIAEVKVPVSIMETRAVLLHPLTSVTVTEYDPTQRPVAVAPDWDNGSLHKKL